MGKEFHLLHYILQPKTMKTCLILLACLMMASASSMGTPETVTQIENRILKTALAKVGKTQMAEWSGSSCSAWEVAECAGSLAVTIAACVAAGITWGAELAGCIGAAVGTADACYECICDVIEFLGMGS